ncbi:MAG TPA: OmpA family protein [Candidatus Kapabacteria bacterium]|nr:OmpA family protein [Candidatus Kapabacteria bacterium]
MTNTVRFAFSLLFVSLCSLAAFADPSPDSLTLFKDKDIVVKNLGENVNSADEDYGPTITANGKTLYFTSTRKGGQGGHDYWYSTMNADSSWTPSVNAGPSINTPADEGVSSLSADGQTIFFTGCNRPDGMGNCDIYQADLVGTEWQNIRNLGPVVNTEYWESQPAISADGKTLYFVSNRPGGLGGTDIWYTTKDANDNWTEPKNMGAPINTADNEVSPFIAADGVTLYFASDGHGGLGGLDFFTSEKTDNGWTQPVNLGAPINTADNEEFITVPASGDILYFSSNRSGGSGHLDIWEAFIKPKPKTVLLVEGRVYDVRTNENLSGHVVYVDSTGDTVANVHSNKSTGEYSFVLNIPGGSFKIYCDEPNHVPVTTSLNVPMKPGQYQRVRKDIPMERKPTLQAVYDIPNYVKKNPALSAYRGLIVEEIHTRNLYPLLQFIFFDDGSTSFASRYKIFTSPSDTVGFDENKVPGGTLEKYYQGLNIIGKRLRQFPDATVTIYGASNQITEGEKKEGIGEQRAKLIYNYFTSIWGIDAKRMTVQGLKLPRHPSNQKDTLGQVENRNVEIAIDDAHEWDILKPVLQEGVTYSPDPSFTKFRMFNGINDENVDHREILLTRGGESWNQMTNVGTADTMSGSYDWKDKAHDTLPLDENPFVCVMNVYGKDGIKRVSNYDTIKVKQITSAVQAAQHLAGREIETYNLILFKFDSPEAGPKNERILSEYIFDRVKPQSDVKITGYTDIIGHADRNKTLSGQRAQTAYSSIKEKTSGNYASMTSEGVGSSQPLYPNELPEGRFYNRTVQIVIETPLTNQ